MVIQTFTNANDFLKLAEPVLEKSEESNCLMLSLAYRLREIPDTQSDDILPFFAIVSEGSSIQLVALMTPPNKIIVYGTGSPMFSPYNLLAQRVWVLYKRLSGVIGPNTVADFFGTVWTQITKTQKEISKKLRVYSLTKVEIPLNRDGELRQATLDDLHLVVDWSEAFHIEVFNRDDTIEPLKAATDIIERGGLYFWVVMGQVVSMANRCRPTKHGYTINLVYTPMEYRGKGYASACVSTLCQSTLDEGYLFCTLFTDLANPTSNSIYKKIGFKPVTDYLDYSFISKS